MEIGMKVKTVFDRYKYVLIVIAAGILLILLPTSSEKPAPADTTFLEFDILAEERRIAKALSSAEGVGKTEVVLSLDSAMETHYLTDEQTKSILSSEQSNVERSPKTVLVSQSGGGQEALVVTRIYPRYKGALVVCEGAGSAAVRLKVTEAVSALTGLASDKITVIASNGSG